MSELTARIEAMEKDLIEVTAFGDWLYDRYGETTWGKNITPLTVAKDKIISIEAHADHTAAIREKAEALVAAIAEKRKVYGEGLFVSDFKVELTALKAELEKGNG